MRWHLSFLAFALALAAHAAHADTITLAQAHAVVDEELRLTAKYYVFPEKRDAIVAAIRAKEKEGAYDLTNPSDLADKLGADTIAVAHDKHMWMQYDPAQFKAVQAPQNDPGAAAYFSRALKEINYGYREMKVLSGNIRYVNLTTFNWAAKSSPPAVGNAARFLNGGDAAIIDLRENGGGSGEAVRAMISYFMPAKKQLLMSYLDTTSGTTGTSYVGLKLAAPRMVGKPLYVLTSPGTGSAAEEFSYHIKMFKLGTLVGETTAGAGNNDTIYPIAPGFVASISTGRAIHPVNHSNWEGTGVVPDVAVPADKALDQAQLLALQKLASMPGADQNAVGWAMDGIKARLSAAPTPDAAALAAYAGTYGIRTLTLTAGKLIYQRQGRSPHPLTFLASDLYELEDDTRLHFQRTGGKVTGFDMLTAEGQKIAVPRT
jgi:hypothetical protein